MELIIYHGPRAKAVGARRPDLHRGRAAQRRGKTMKVAVHYYNYYYYYYCYYYCHYYYVVL